MVSNQGWGDDRLQPRQRGTHTVKEANMPLREKQTLVTSMNGYW
jgi:hypothetical protein